MRLLRRTLLITLYICIPAYLFDLTGGICQIALGKPRWQEVFTQQRHAGSSSARDIQQRAAIRSVMLATSSSSMKLPAAERGPSWSPSTESVTEKVIDSERESLNPLLPFRARKFQPYVERHSEKFQISSCLIYAVIKAESDFNVMAVSPASAYGLMQLVPESGGRAAYRLVYGSDEIPSREYLEDPDKNIELGAAYLRLAGDFFAEVEDQISREYCQIAAYNTGAGNVLKAFGGGYSQAIAMINSLSPEKVYEHLTTNLPYEETRNYLPKVLAYRREFASL